MFKKLVILFTAMSTAVCAYGQNAVMINKSNSVITYPSNFWSANAIQGRSGLGLGSAATNPASAFQASSAVLSNLATSNGILLTNLSASNVKSGILSLAFGGTGGTNSAQAISNLGGTTVGSSFLTLPNPGAVSFVKIESNNSVSTLSDSNFRTALGLGTAATNSTSQFQPSSTTLSNLALGNGGELTNLQASNLVGTIPMTNIGAVSFTNVSGVLTLSQGGTSATNASDARQNFGITTVGDALFTAANQSSARVAIGATDIGSGLLTLANPNNTSFLRVNANNTVSALSAVDFRNAIELGSSATNASSAFQPASSMLTNLASSNGFYLSNIQASNVTGIISVNNGGTGADNATNARANLGLGSAAVSDSSAFQPSSTVLSNLANNNGGSLTNITISNLTGVLTTNGNAVNLTNFPTLLLRTNGDGAGLTNLTASKITGTVALASNLSGVLAISNGGTGATNAATARTNLALGWGALTNTNGAKALYSVLATSLLGYTDEITASSTNATGNNIVTYSNTNTLVVPADLLIAGDSVPAPRSSRHVQIQGTATMRDPFTASTVYGSTYVNVTDESSYTNTVFDFSSGSSVSLGIPIGFSTNIVKQQTLTNLGLDWSALTNSNAGTSLVSVNTNGQVVSPTNFWQVAPIQTLVQSTIPVTNSTNAATNARNLYIYSLATNVVGVTNTITLPTNTSSFDGDEVTVIHRGGSNSVTAVRQLGSTNNLISLNSYDESVKFIKDGNWDFYHNISFTEAIRFSGTNAAANAGASRTNLALGENADVAFNNVTIVDQTLTLSSGPEDDVFVRNDSGNLELGTDGIGVSLRIDPVASNAVFNTPLNFNNTTTAATTRTNLGTPLAALTNTNNATFQQAIFTTNTTPTNAGTFGDYVAWMGVSIVTNGVTNVFKIPLYK